MLILVRPVQYKFYINYSSIRFRFNNCFGVLGILDWLHGTDTLFRQTSAFDRHIVMLNAIPAREAFPDIQKKTT